MANNDFFIPSDPVDVPVRPLTKGVFLDLSANVVPEGGFTYLNNYHITERGLRRRPKWSVCLNGSAVPGVSSAKLVDMQGFWGSAENTILALIASDYIHSITDVATTECYWTYTTGTATGTGTSVTGIGTSWNAATAHIQAGDRFLIGDEDAEVASVGGATSITLTSPGLTGNYVGQAYTIRRTFNLNGDGNIDSTMAVSSGVHYLVLADGQRPPYTFDGAALTSLNTSLTYFPTCVCFYKDRLFIANTVESSTSYPQRIRWSSATDFTSFTAGDYIDLPYTSAMIRKILPLKQALIVYTGTGIYFGRPTTLPSLPVVFDLLPNSSAGLAGQRAVVSWFGGHFYAGRNDIFFLDENGTISPMGSPGVRTLLKQCTAPQKIQAVVDVARDRVVFALPQDSEKLSVLISFYYNTKSWGIEYLEADMIACPNAFTGISWDNIDTFTPYTPGDPEGWDTTNGVEAFGSWDSISGDDENASFYYGTDMYLHRLSSTGGADERMTYTDEAITAEFITPEMDFNELDDEKTFLRFSLKLKERPSADLVYSIYASYDGGYNWNSLGLITIDNTHREGKVDFIVTAASVMFKGVSNSVVNPYEAIEYCVKVQKRGDEVHKT